MQLNRIPAPYCSSVRKSGRRTGAGGNRRSKRATCVCVHAPVLRESHDAREHPSVSRQSLDAHTHLPSHDAHEHPSSHRDRCIWRRSRPWRGCGRSSQSEEALQHMRARARAQAGQTPLKARLADCWWQCLIKMSSSGMSSGIRAVCMCWSEGDSILYTQGCLLNTEQEDAMLRQN
jgi:hypothetical protein